MSERWLVDTNVVIYLLTDHPEFRERLRVLRRRMSDEGARLVAVPAVVAEVLYVLEGEYFRMDRQDAASLLLRFCRAPEVECEDGEAVLRALKLHGERRLDFVDGYLAARCRSEGWALLTNDRGIGRKAEARLVEW
ncbi:MAG: PIN domain-containing protein [Clostridia bacterium]|nr:PIN domain-containing protein [Clostridia bacterium]